MKFSVLPENLQRELTTVMPGGGTTDNRSNFNLHVSSGR